MNWYEAKQEARRQRYAERAEMAQGQFQHHVGAALRSIEHIPPGQPILVGHHSERRHRRDLARSDAHMRKASDAQGKADHYARKAAGVGKGGVSSDDPDAPAKLREKLAGLEQHHAEMKRVNAQYRKGGWDAVEGISDKLRAYAKRTMELCPWEKMPFPGYALSNNSANMRRIRQRIEALEAAERHRESVQSGEVSEAVIEGPGYVLREDAAENRIMFEFRGKPPEDVRSLLKQWGFKWSRDRMAWVRFLNNAGRAAAQYVARQLNESEALR